MNKSQSLFSQLFSLLKRERKVKNTTQAVEFISVFIYLKHLQMRMDEDCQGFYYDNKRDFLSICHQIIRNSTFNGHTLYSSSNVEDFLVNSIDNFILNVDNDRLIRCLSELLNSINNTVELRALKSIYNELIEKMVLESSQSGEFYTPKVIAEVVVSYLKPNSEDIIYDPACGTSGFLLETAKYLEENGRIDRNLITLYGDDISFFAFVVSKVNLILNSELDSCIRLGDSLEKLDYSHDVYNTNRHYDIVLTNPPFGKNNNNLHGYDQDQYIDYKFLRLAMYSMKEGGRAAIILPERFFYDYSYQAKSLKGELFKSFNVDCILSLPSGAMLPYTGVKLVVVFFSLTVSSGKTWLYKLTKKEKLTKNKKLEAIDFMDFIDKSKFKEESANSWNIDISELEADFNVFEKVKRQTDYSDFALFSESIGDFTKVGGQIRESINVIDERVKSIQSHVSDTNKQYTFSKVKVGEIISSCKTAPLSKEKLLPEGSYPVYGGNGVIGYYDDNILSGKFILVGRVGALCGNIHYVEGSIWVTNNSIALECTDLERVYPPYLARVLSNKDLRGLASGTAQPHLTVTKVKNIEVKLPPVKAQIELERWLSQLDKELHLQNTLANQLISKGESLQNELNHHLLQI